MQYHDSAGIAQRLIKEKSFREAVRTAFSGRQSADLLERCKALNACIRQGRAPQPVQQETSPTDSDICSQCSTSDSDIPDEEQAGGSTSAVANETNLHSSSCVRRQPTLVQHAAAATIQRRFRQHLRSRLPDRIGIKQCCPDQIISSTNNTAKDAEEADTRKQHNAASYIQAWWRNWSSKGLQLAAPLTPPCSSSNMPTSCSSIQSSRPDSAASSSQSELEAHPSENRSMMALASQARPSSASLSQLRVRSAAQRRKAFLPHCRPAANTAAMLVVQRTSDRAQQVQVMEQKRWRIAQTKSG